MFSPKYIIYLLFLLCGGRVLAHTPIGFAYWDVDQFYDTIPSKFYDDSEFTPKGRNRWGTQRYRRKVEHTAAVVDSMRLPMVALFGVESEDVVRDIVCASKRDYSYLHRTIDGRDGLDFALLYYGDIFFIDYVHSDYGRLYIEGEILGKRVGVWLARNGYLQKSATPPHRDGVDIMIVAGGFYHKELEKISMKDCMAQHERAGHGNATSSRGWYMRHRIGVREGVQEVKSGVYITPWLLTKDYRSPQPTLSRSGYYGGYSSYLPIYLYFSIDN